MQFHNSIMGLLLGVLLLLVITKIGPVGADLIASEALTQDDQFNSNTIYAEYGLMKCMYDEHAEPDSTEDISRILRNLHSSGRPFKVRATRRGSHSSSGIACPGTSANTKMQYGENSGVKNGGPDTRSVVILMHRMNRVLAVDAQQHRLTVQVGMTVQNLADAAVANGMSVPVGVMPVYGNLTVSGLIATSAHGSGAGVDSTLGDLVTGLEWVNSSGHIITSENGDEQGLSEIRALVGGLGLLGVLSVVTIQLLGPDAMTQVDVWKIDDSNIVADVKHQLQHQTPHILYYWRPDLQFYRALYLSTPLPGDQNHPVYPKGRSAMLDPSTQAMATIMTNHMAAYAADLDDSAPDADVLNAKNCALADEFMHIPFLLEGDVMLENATIPTSHAFIAQECYPRCIWNHNFFGSTVEDNEFTIKLSDLDEWVKDVRYIIGAEHAEKQKHLELKYGKGKVERICLPPGYFWLRFGKSSEFLTAINTGWDEPVVYIMVTFFTSGFHPHAPSKLDHVSEVIEQLSICKYGARPHWGKNTERIFSHHDCHVRDNYPEQNMVKFLKLREEHDPLKVFESELLNRVLERRGPVYEDKCALKRKCYCKQDSHCADGFRCQPSVSFPEYNVCKVQYPHQRQQGISHQEL